MELIFKLERRDLNSLNVLIPKLQKVVNEQPAFGVIRCLNYILYPTISILKASNSKTLGDSGFVFKWKVYNIEQLL